MNHLHCEALSIPIPGGRVHLKRWLPGASRSAVPVVLLHDSLGCVDLWRDFPEQLATQLSRPVLAYDRLGFGRSSAVTQRPGMAFIEEEAERHFPALREALAMERYLLLGHSVGGAMAISIAARDHRCCAVITEAAQAFVEQRTLAGIRQAKRRFREPGQLERLARWHGEKAGWVLRAWTDVWLSPEFSSWSLAPCIDRVQCPLLAIHGDSDEYGTNAFPEFLTGRSCGPSHMAILDRCGHVPHREQPREVLVQVRAFLETQSID